MFWPLALIGLVISLELEAKQVTIWHQKERATPIIQEVLKPLEQRFDVEFSVHYFATNDLKTALISSAYNGKQPNVVLIPSDFFGEYKSFGLLPIPDPLRAKLPTDNVTWQQSRIDQRFYGIPLYIGNHMLLYYNKSVIKAPASSWQQLIAQKSQLMHGQKLIGWNYKELFWFVHFASAFNAFPVTKGDVSLDTKEFASALTFYRNLSLTGLIPSTCDYGCSSKRFINGEFAYSLNGDWAFRELKDALGQQLGIAPLPNIDGNPMKSYYSTLNLAFPGRTEHAEFSQLDLAIINKFFERQNQIVMFEQLGLLPTTPATRKSLEVSEDYKQVLQTLELAIPLPSSSAMTAAWAGMRKGLDYFLAQDVSPKQASSIMQKVADRELARLEGSR